MTTHPQNNAFRYIILDSSIFEHLKNAELKTQILNELAEALKKQYRLSFSIYTLLELVDTATVENELEAMNVTHGLKRFHLKQDIMLGAGHLGCLYTEDGLESKQQPQKGDKIIGATAILNDTLIFTTNGRHFPRPFFKTIYKPLFKHTKPDGREVFIVGYFIEPDHTVIQTKYQNRVDEHKKKTTPTLNP